MDWCLLRLLFLSLPCNKFVAFIFGALLEFALVNYAARKDLTLEANRRRRQNAMTSSTINEGQRQPLLTNPQSYQQVVQQQNSLPPGAYCAESGYDNTTYPKTALSMVRNVLMFTQIL
jgi:hypothetical protein